MKLQLHAITYFLCCPAQHWTEITLLLYYYQRNIERISWNVYVSRELGHCFSYVPTVNIPSFPDWLPFISDSICAIGGDSFSFFIDFTLSYLHSWPWLSSLPWVLYGMEVVVISALKPVWFWRVISVLVLAQFQHVQLLPWISFEGWCYMVHLPLSWQQGFIS